LFHTLQVFNSDNDLLYENKLMDNRYTRSPNIVTEIIREREKNWSIEKLGNFKKAWQSVIELMKIRKAPSNDIINLRARKPTVLIVGR
jgi:hypothetical protein